MITKKVLPVHDLSRFFCFCQGECAIVSSINDKNDWKSVKNALQVIEFDETNTNVSLMVLQDPVFTWRCW